jgi:hypothetical protein
MLFKKRSNLKSPPFILLFLCEVSLIPTSDGKLWKGGQKEIESVRRKTHTVYDIENDRLSYTVNANRVLIQHCWRVPDRDLILSFLASQLIELDMTGWYHGGLTSSPLGGSLE